jgi:hypothetical protein
MSGLDSLIPAMSQQMQGSTTAPNNKPFMTPWLDYSTVTVPDNHELVMWWAQYLWLTDGNFRTAMERVAAHFMTVLEFPDLEPDEESSWKDFFNNEINYRRELMSVAYDFLAYGNCFVSPYLPFKRFMRCQKCFLEQPIDRVDYNLEFSAVKPYVKWHRKHSCPRCDDTGDYEVLDRRDRTLSKIKLNRYDPAEIELAQNRFSLRKDVYWKIPEETRRDILEKARIHIDDTPLEVLEAVAVNGRLCFEEDMILHIDEPIISGVRSRGWGLPRSISNFRTAWLQQLINKTDQAVAIDYTLGMRVLSPAPTPGGQDPMVTTGMEQFVTRIKSMVQEHRNNPASYHTAPYPIQYQFLGGEGGTLMPPEKLKFRQQEYLNQLGVPLEYHQMNLSTQAAPMALRLFESYWQVVPTAYNRVLDWLVDILSKVYGMEPTKVRMQKTTIADDMERKAVLLQLMSANQLSPQTALQPFGIDAHDEVKKVIRHQEFVSRQQDAQAEKDAQREEMGALRSMTAQPSPATLQAQQAQAAAGAAGPAGAPMGGMPTGGMPGVQSQTPSSLGEMSEQAQGIAQQLVTMDDYSRKGELKALREGNKDLHALVMQNLDDLRSQAKSQGGQMLLSGGMPAA